MEFKLIIKKITDRLSDEEAKIFEAWYNESNEHRVYFHRAKHNYDKHPDEIEIEEAWNVVFSRLAKRKRRLRYGKYAATIGIALLTTLGVYYVTTAENSEIASEVQQGSVVENPIQVGTDKAVLTLDDGAQIALGKGNTYTTEKASSDGEQLVYKNNQETASKIISQNILTTPRGGQFYIVLADGTKVWCNSETQLKYPVSFTTNQTREVELMHGEAYFEVSPSSDHNGMGFIVLTEKQQIQVLGTAFNIKAYIGEKNIATTLVEGKISVKADGKTENLKPGHQSNLNRITNDISIFKVDVYDEVSWKNGLFSFKRKPLKDIMKVLSRWYDVEVIFNNKEKEKIAYNGIFRKTQRLDQILTILRNTNEIDFEIDGKTIRVN